MKFLCLRDCYVNDRFWHQGEVYELPEAMEKSEKNFKPIEEPIPDAPELPTSPVESNICPVCGKECKSPFGLRAHMRKHK